MKKLLSIILFFMLFPQFIFSKTNENNNSRNIERALTSCTAIAVTTCIRVNSHGETYTVQIYSRATSWSRRAPIAEVCAAAQSAVTEANINACGN
ncbi:hypothetical protein [Aquirufa salirivi]|uniref:DUF4189 domain-containing protein n=1 Tax=Aquirufa salirivi TaxID=3104729 RepID=A0ABW8RX24_9BACT